MPIVIDTKLKGLSTTNSGLAKMVSWIDRANASLTKTNNLLIQVAQNAGVAAQALGGVNASPARGSGSMGSGASSVYRGAKPPSPFANNPRAGQSYYAPGAARGNVAHARLFNRYSGQVNSVNRGQANAQNLLRFGGASNPLSSVLTSALGSTRFGRGGGQVLGHVVTSLLGTPGGAGALSGLMGGGASAGGAGALAAGAGLLTNPIGLAAAAVGAFAAAVAKGASVLNAWNQSVIDGGGTLRQATAASAFGSVSGINVAGLGSGLSGFAAARLGLNPNSGPFGDIDYNQRGLRALDDIRRSGSTDEARRKAILAGDPNAARVYGMKDANYDSLRNQPAGNAGFMQSAKNVGDSFGRLTVAVDRTFALFSGPALKAIDTALTFAADRLETFNRAFTWVLDHLPKVIQNAIGWTDDHKRALDRNSKALDDNTDAQYREGSFGGGGRTQGANRQRIFDGSNGNSGYGRLANGLL